MAAAAPPEEQGSPSDGWEPWAERLSFGCLVVPSSQAKRAKTRLEAASWLDKRFKLFAAPGGRVALPVSSRLAQQGEPATGPLAVEYEGLFDPALCPPELQASPAAPGQAGRAGLVRVVELFAGIGGFRLGCSAPEREFEVVFASEIDRWARMSYQANFGPMADQPDLTLTPAEAVPAHELLTGTSPPRPAAQAGTAGFPCQSFSGMGQQRGLEDERGQLFWQVIRVARRHRPKVILLENVLGLLAIDQGRALELIVSSLEAAGYKVQHRQYDACDFGVAQHRKRVYFVCTANQREFGWPEPPSSPLATVEQVLEPSPESRYTLSEHQWAKVQQQPYFAKHPEARLARTDSQAQTLSSNYKSGYLLYSQFVPQEGAAPRFFTPRECARLMGFPESFDVDGCGNEGQFYRQIGNAVCPPVVQAIVQALVEQSFL